MLFANENRPNLRCCLSSLSLEQLSAIGRLRREHPCELPKLLRGHLDWIVLRAVEKDRARRYPTVNSLATSGGASLDGKVTAGGDAPKILGSGGSQRAHRRHAREQPALLPHANGALCLWQVVSRRPGGGTRARLFYATVLLSRRDSIELLIELFHADVSNQLRIVPHHALDGRDGSHLSRC